MRKDEHKTHEPKGVYRVRNWSAYNAGLVARGDVTMWLDKSMLTQDPEVESRKRGRPCIYSDSVIQMLMGLKQVFRLPLRALQGFACSLRKLAFADLPVPNYTTLSRRAQDLNVVLPAWRSGEPLHVSRHQYASATLNTVVDAMKPDVVIVLGKELQTRVLPCDLAGVHSSPSDAPAKLSWDLGRTCCTS